MLLLPLMEINVLKENADGENQAGDEWGMRRASEVMWCSNCDFLQLFFLAQ